MKDNRMISYYIQLLLLGGLLFACRPVAEQATPGETIEGTIRLSLNENPFPVSTNVKEAILNELSEINRYAAADGEEFVRVVAKHEGVAEEQVIPGEILDLLGVYLGLKAGEGGEFIYSVPGYPALVNAAASVGGKVIAVPLTETHENDLQLIEASITDKTVAVFLVNPHNPTGTAIEADLLAGFINRVSSKVLVIVDEAYLEYADNFSQRTVLRHVQAGENVMLFRTLAKTYGLAGLNIGYALAPKELALYLKSKGLGNTHALNRLAVVAAKAALSDQQLIDQQTRTVIEERDKWHAFLDQHGIEHTNSKANFIFFTINKPYEEVNEQLTAAGIHVGKPYAAPYASWIRISIGLPHENERVRDVLRKIM